MTTKNPLPPAFAKAFKRFHQPEKDLMISSSEGSHAVDSSTLPPEFLEKYKTLLAEMQIQVMGAQCEQYQSFVSLVLALRHRLSEEVRKTEVILNSFINCETDIVNLLDEALKSQADDQLGLKNGLRLEYLGILLGVLTQTIQECLKEVVSGSCNLESLEKPLALAYSHAGKVYEVAIDEFLGFLYPNQEEKNPLLKELITGQFLDQNVRYFYSSVLPQLVPLMEATINVPRVWNVLGVAVSDFRKDVRSEVGRNAVMGRHKARKPVEEEALKKYWDSNREWNSHNAAGVAIYQEMMREKKVVEVSEMSELRAPATMAQWFRSYDVLMGATRVRKK